MTDLQILSGSIADLKWFQENSSKIKEKYEGEFIAIQNQEVVEFAPTAKILIKKLDKKGENSNLVLIKYVVPKGEIVIL